ncbi:MAG: transcription antitermination factor NusB [Candidatus Omnitrophica bacterium]|nr:transcription antitermination factor NusB [Candidatus Omnitrophota bacterium]MDD5436035.1 transcription antitermination factor NusB [Candidatus Omnitrophota bacterium]
MRKRTKARENALKILYAIDITGDEPKKCIDRYWKDNEEKDAEVKRFANSLVLGAFNKQKEIDKLISESATNWQLNRMAVIDRNILRFAAYELLFIDEIPPKVTINEAIDIAKRYGDSESGKFVNGILDKINKDIAKKAK